MNAVVNTLRASAVFALAGCSGGGADCATLSIGDCAANEACTALAGRKVRTLSNGWCLEADPSQLGCLAIDQGCDDVETWAAPPGDGSGCHWFPSACVPTGWTECVGFDPYSTPDTGNWTTGETCAD